MLTKGVAEIEHANCKENTRRQGALGNRINSHDTFFRGRTERHTAAWLSTAVRTVRAKLGVERPARD